jgi:RNA polymerase sigma-70 factor (ECF subfamily)
VDKKQIILNNKIESIFHQYYSPLCNYATKIISDSTIAEDIVQDLFVQLWENEKLESIENTERFLLRATKYKCIDYLRTKRINSEIPIENLPEIIYTENKEINEEDIEPLFYYYTSKLPPKTREIFLLSRKSGLTYKEIANDLNISVKTVENQMSRALRIMRDLLKDNELLIFIMGLNFFK